MVALHPRVGSPGVNTSCVQVRPHKDSCFAHTPHKTCSKGRGRPLKRVQRNSIRRTSIVMIRRDPNKCSMEGFKACLRLFDRYGSTELEPAIDEQL